MPAKTARTKAAGPIYQIKITLKGWRPPIWRRVLVPSHFTLAQLHWVVQQAMGWSNSHLHLFRVGDRRYSEPFPGAGWEEMEMEDARRVTLARVAPEVKMTFEYEYDFGDSWEHEIRVEKILPPGPGAKYPVCLKGKGACPPEDVGGVWGYAGFLEAMADPEHTEHEMYMKWIGGEFDPDAFDLDDVNQALRRIG